MIETVAHFLKAYPTKHRYLVGVSGGLDSTVLLHLLHRLGYQSLIAVHLNHGLRRRESGADAAFVKRLAKRLDCELQSERQDLARQAAARKLSLETAAREARYRYFAEVARRRRCRSLFLAHHADDQVETVLMRLFRGTGSTGLGGMRAVAHRTVEGVDLEIIRPLLPVTRAELEDYAETAPRIRFRQDASNSDLQFLRNRVRHELIPKLNTLFERDVRNATLRLADQCRAESECLDDLVAVPSDDLTLSVRWLRELPLALQRRALHRWLAHHGVAGLDFDRVQEALSLIEKGTSKAKINLPRNRHLRRRRGVLFIE